MARNSIGTFIGIISKHTAIQREVLDVIGNALKHRQIDFLTATKLGDQLRAGREDKVILTLNKITGSSIRFSDLLIYNGPN